MMRYTPIEAKITPMTFFGSNLAPFMKYIATKKAIIELRFTIAFDFPGLSHVCSDKN